MNGRLSRVDTASGALPTDTNPASSDSYTRTAGTNRLASLTTPAGTRTISYDARGNTSAETRPGGVSVTTAYDGYGRLTGYTRTGDPSQTNLYNGLDDRVTVTSGSVTRRFVYDADGRVMGEYGTSATDVIAEFIWLSPEVGDGSVFGGGDGTSGYAPLAVASGPPASSTLLWAHGNHLGVPQLYTNASGAPASPGAWQLPGFPGQSRTLADLYYNRHRDYDPSTGRYIQADPIGLDGDVNPYVYAGANPLTGMDPDGLNALTMGGGTLSSGALGAAARAAGRIALRTPIGAGFALGWALGTWLNQPVRVRRVNAPYCPPVLIRSGGTGTDGRDDGYSEGYYRDLQRCRRLRNKGAKARCFGSAELREAYRRKGRSEESLPPLIEW